MSIRTRTLLIVGLTSLVLIAALYAVSQLFILQGYLTLEQETLQRNVQRGLNATEEEIAFVRKTSHDYAHWDDTYQFIQGLDDSYIDANDFETVLANFGLNFILFVNDAGDIVYSLAMDSASGETQPVPDSLTALVT